MLHLYRQQRAGANSCDACHSPAPIRAGLVHYVKTPPGALKLPTVGLTDSRSKQLSYGRQRWPLQAITGLTRRSQPPAARNSARPSPNQASAVLPGCTWSHCSMSPRMRAGLLQSHLLGNDVAWLILTCGSGVTRGLPWSLTTQEARMRVRSVQKFRDRELNPGLLRDRQKY